MNVPSRINKKRTLYAIRILQGLLLLCSALNAKPILAEPSSQFQEGAWLQTHSAAGRISVKSWKTRRDAKIVKQDSDYSCGAASLATLLTEYYRFPVTE